MNINKFRGKILNGERKGQWVYGSYLEFTVQGVKHARIVPIFDCKEALDDTMEITIDCIAVDPKTVGQYTGFNDSNKKEIYDNDVLQCTPNVEVYRQCVWSNGEYYLVEVNVPRTISFPLGAVSTSHKNAKIIGNIHDNKNLLTQ